MTSSVSKRVRRSQHVKRRAVLAEEIAHEKAQRRGRMVRLEIDDEATSKEYGESP